METLFLELLTANLATIIKPKYNKLISHGFFFDTKLVYSLTWIYKYYFELPVFLFLPKCVNINLDEFNKLVGDYPLTQEDMGICSLESIENINSKVVIFGFADLIFNELVTFKRRINTRIKALKSKVIILSYSSLKMIDLVALDSFEYIEFTPLPTFDYIDLLDNDEEIYLSNVESLVEFIDTNKDKKIYLSLELPLSKILYIEKLLPSFSRKETGGSVINSSKTLQKTFLTGVYDIYIFINQPFIYPLDFMYYLKEAKSGMVYVDSSYINHPIKIKERFVYKDSVEYPTYKELIKDLSDTDPVVVSEAYYNFDTSDSIKQMDLYNLSKKDYDTIRYYVKIKLNGKFDIDIKTCQLSAPCSPKDRSKKLNSLSNKISSYDYRCEVTCEIFRDYTIGVILWNEMFADRKPLKMVKGSLFVHQTTSGTWKFTTVT
jgi:hypothetical protein